MVYLSECTNVQEDHAGTWSLDDGFAESKDSTCEIWKELGWCGDRSEFMLENCRKECNYCILGTVYVHAHTGTNIK